MKNIAGIFSPLDCLPVPEQLIYIRFQDAQPLLNAVLFLKEGKPFFRIKTGLICEQIYSLDSFPFNSNAAKFIQFMFPDEPFNPHPKAEEVKALFNRETGLDICFSRPEGQVICVRSGKFCIRIIEVLEPFVQRGILRKGEGEADFYIV